MADDDDAPIVIGNWAELLTATERTRASGKQRVSFEVSGDALMFDMSEHTLGAPIAEAMVEAFKEALTSSTEQAKPTTQTARQRAAIAFSDGKRWAREKYAGGRIGPMAPNQTAKRGTDSGRLGRSLSARWVPSIRQFVVNTAANRLTEKFRASVQGQQFLAWLGRLMAPALQSETVNKGVAKALNLTVTAVADARAAVRKRVMDNARALVDAARGLGAELDSPGDEEP